MSFRQSVVVAAALSLGFACAPAMEPVGITPANSHLAPAPPSASASVPAWKHAAALKGFPRAHAKRFPSAGHLFGRFDADVFVNEPARATYASVAPGSTAPVGAIVVEVHTNRDGSPGPVFAMEKGAAGWTYIELDPRLRVVRQGHLSPCAECHGHVASQDELFGVPASGH